MAILGVYIDANSFAAIANSCWYKRRLLCLCWAHYGRLLGSGNPSLGSDLSHANSLLPAIHYHGYQNSGDAREYGVNTDPLN